MFSQAENDKIARDTAENGVADFIDTDFEGKDFSEILELAIDKAIDEFDAEIESDGMYTDCTPYEDCARRATEEWLEAKENEEHDRGDYLYHLSIDA